MVNNHNLKINLVFSFVFFFVVRVTDPVMSDSKINLPTWLDEYKHHFIPPVSNHFMHFSGQMTVMYVGGPNQRSDYHVQRGEELFFQHKGDMVLKVVVKGRKKDVQIKEGEILLLPACIPHSPQRFNDTLGLVIERRRRQDEIDILRFYCPSEDPTDLSVLFERTFHWNNEPQKMIQYLQEFANSSENKTGKPTQNYTAIFETDNVSELKEPFNLHTWITNNSQLIDKHQSLCIFGPPQFKFTVLVYGGTTHTFTNDKAETWFNQYKGESKLTLPNKTIHLSKDDTYLLPIGETCKIEQKAGNYLLAISQEE